MMDATETGGDVSDVDTEEVIKNDDEADHHVTNVKKKIPITEDDLMGQVSWRIEKIERFR